MSEINWHQIQRKLEGRCHMCGGDLPKHRGVCPVYGETLHKKYDNLTHEIDKLDSKIAKVIKNV
jgi:RNA polymerase subunit RPABC4/transcription elongation factor Spt4|tara:strand:- start:88 stop:279 length:192 start_codon:yes stop_codon:yes gene_type:complete